MITILTSLLALNIGLLAGYFARELKESIRKILNMQPVKQEPKVVVPHMPTSGSAKVDSKGRVIMPKTPAQMQVERDNKFSRTVQ